ncbi:MAG: penicillin-binding protein, partial [Thermodesulfobacteriota bacterium]|nr:penicillin-binding protein [Thermodesulfobacteriota bacterium]
LDSNIQYIVERELQKTVKKYNAKSGTVIVIHPQTGEILAMASKPSYNPNNPGKSKPQHKKIRAINDCFEPGSTFKVFLLAGALEDEIITPQDILFCENGRFRYGGRIINDVHKHKWLSVSKIIAFSSNIGATKIGEKLGKERLYYYIKKLGFGDRTGIDLPGETCGIVYAPSRWSKVRLATTSFGQGISVTSIQIAAALSAIANGGMLMKPYIVKEIRDKNGNIVESFTPKIKKRVISTHTCELTKNVLEEVVAPEATGLNAAIPGYDVAGKTGTAQKVGKTGTYSDCQYTSSFIGFISASPPELVIVVVIDEPEGSGYGGVVSAPLFSKIGKQTLSYLGVMPSKPSITDKNSILIVKRENKNQSTLKLLSNFPENDKEPMMPDFTGMTMRHVFKIINKYKIRVKITGSGIVVGQNPSPGNSLPEDGEGWVILQPPA